jgi:hypothetical protein
MNLTRETVLAKLTGYLDKEISKSAIYEWALFVAVSKEYEQLAPQDPLIATAVQALIDINHDDLKKIPTNKALEYYRRCLKDEIEFIPLEERRDIDKLVIQDQQPAAPAITVPPETSLVNALLKKQDYTRLLIAMRVYVIVFAVCSLGIHIYSFINPEFMQMARDFTSRFNSVKESLPHVLYALLVLLPPRFLARDTLYIVSLALLIVGFFYYWYIAITIVDKLALHPLLILIILPFSALPATLTLILLWAYRQTFTQKPSIN